jgi:thiamine pyrophosphate-dependent acetolactate synthase large subunit-like protein
MNAAKPFTKAAFRVNRPEDIGIGIARAIRAALSGRPGGVYLDLPGAQIMRSRSPHFGDRANRANCDRSVTAAKNRPELLLCNS